VRDVLDPVEAKNCSDVCEETERASVANDERATRPRLRGGAFGLPPVRDRNAAAATTRSAAAQAAAPSVDERVELDGIGTWPAGPACYCLGSTNEFGPRSNSKAARARGDQGVVMPAFFEQRQNLDRIVVLLAS
jgi:hypothetical protein